MNKSVLIVDDSPLARSMLETLLTASGYRTFLAEDGIDGAICAYRKQPDLIFADIEMPKMNGFQLCRLLKSDEHTKHIPTIILTSKDEASSMFWGLDTGADRYVLKSSSAEEILLAAKELLHDSRHPQSPPSPGLMGQWDIVQKVNNLLDQKLFETTVTNELNKIIFRAETVKDGVLGLFEVMEKIIDYSVISYLSLHNRDPKLFFRLRESIDQETFQDIQFFMLKFLTNMNIEIPDELDVDLEGQFGERSYQIELDHIYFLPLTKKSESLGVLSIVVRDPQKLRKEDKAFLSSVSHVVSLVIDNVCMHEKIKTMSAIDSLTHIYNRRNFMEFLERELSRSKRFKQDVSLIMLDIDDFKQVNDTYNHLSGDMVLKDLSAVLRKTIRQMDVPARYGGEEFIVLLPKSGLDNALTVAERIRKNVAEFDFRSFDHQPIQITVSLGLASTEDQDVFDNPLELIRISDVNLYKAKRGGKNRICY